MNSLRRSQESFMHYLLTGDDGTFRGEVLVDERVSLETRMRIYANAYRVRLRETIETDHEMLGLYLGDELFEKMVEGYVENYPSRYPSLRDFTVHLSQYLTQQSPFSEYPILAELARFERLLLDVFDALDVARATMDDLRALPPQHWPGMYLRFHPSVQIFHADWNSVEAWNALKHGKVPDAALPQANSQWLVWRGIDRLSQFRSMMPEEIAMLNAALHGHDFSAMCESLLPWHNEDDVAGVSLTFLADWLDHGIIHHIQATQ
jgi:hypothetical protein